MKKGLWVGLWLFLSLPAAWSQVSRNTALFFRWESSSLSAAEVAFVEDSLLTKLATVPPLLITQESLPSDSASLVDYNRQKGYDSFLVFSFTGSAAQLTVRWYLYDFVFERRVVEREFQSRVDSDASNLLGGFWIQTVKTIQNNLFAFSWRIPIRITVLPFAKIYGLTAPLSCHQADAEGLIELEMEAFQRVEIAIQAPGYYTKHLSFVAIEQSQPYHFELEKKKNLNFEVGFANMRHLRFGVGGMVLPDLLFVGASMTVNSFQLLVKSGDPNYNMGGPYAPHALALDFRLAAYLDASAVYLRFPIGLEYSLRFNTSPAIPGALDPLAFSSFSLPIGMELFLFDHVLFFAEWNPKLYLTRYPETWNGVEGIGKTQVWVIPKKGVSSVLEFESGNVGLRFQL